MIKRNSTEGYIFDHSVEFLYNKYIQQYNKYL